MKVVCDTGALISLACSDHIDLCFKNFKIFTTNAVKKELEEFAKYEDFLGNKAKEVLKFIHNKKINLIKPHKILKLNISLAEKEVASITKEKRLLVITDDIRAARIMNNGGIKAEPSIHLLYILYKNKKISKEELKTAIERISKDRGWLTGALFEYASRLIDKI